MTICRAGVWHAIRRPHRWLHVPNRKLARIEASSLVPVPPDPITSSDISVSISACRPEPSAGTINSWVGEPVPVPAPVPPPTILRSSSSPPIILAASADIFRSILSFSIPDSDREYSGYPSRVRHCGDKLELNRMHLLFQKPRASIGTGL